MNEPRIEVRNLGKRFRSRGGKRSRSLWAIRGVDFQLGSGEVLGVMGGNGAGKSTLLRMLGGLGRPSEGEVRVRGRIGALLELGGGFLGDLTGRENAILAGVVAGLLRSEIEERMEAIVAFAELEAFIDEPVRNYSSGMTMRLAFSVAVHTDPGVLLVDEFLAVGDLAFQAKCRRRIEAMRSDGCAIVMVSQGMEPIRTLCDRAIWLREGRVAGEGEAGRVAGLYEEEMRLETLRRTPKKASKVLADGQQLEARRNRFGSGDGEIGRVRLVPGPVMSSGGALAVEIDFIAHARLPSPVFVVTVTDRSGSVCLDLNTQSARAPVPDLEGGGSIRLEVDRLDLAEGEYRLSVGMFRGDWKHAYDFHWASYPLRVEGLPGGKGSMAPPVRWTMEGGERR